MYGGRSHDLKIISQFFKVKGGILIMYKALNNNKTLWECIMARIKDHETRNKEVLFSLLDHLNFYIVIWWSSLSFLETSRIYKGLNNNTPIWESIMAVIKDHKTRKKVMLIRKFQKSIFWKQPQQIWSVYLRMIYYETSWGWAVPSSGQASTCQPVTLFLFP